MSIPNAEDLMDEYDKEKIRLGYTDQCQVDWKCKQHAFGRCEGEYTSRFFGVLWTGCGKRCCFEHMIVEYKSAPSFADEEYQLGEKDEICRHCTAPDCLAKFKKARCRPILYFCVIIFIVLLLVTKTSELILGKSLSHHLENTLKSKLKTNSSLDISDVKSGL